MQQKGRCRILSVHRLQGSAGRSVALRRPRGGGELAPEMHDFTPLRLGHDGKKYREQQGKQSTSYE